MKTVIIFIFTALSIISHCPAQFSKYFTDQRTHSYIAVSGLDNIPPLQTDMPLDCMIGYIVMDSLSRTAGIDFVKNQPYSTSLDSLRVAARYMYAVADYSPNLLMRYMTSTQDIVPGGTYLSFPANSYFGLQHAILKRINEFGKNYAMLLATHYVLRITVDTVITGIDTTYPNPVPWVNVSCTVLERLKGQILPNNCRFYDNKENDRLQIESNCLNFGYPLNWMTGGGFFNEKGVNTGTYIRTLQPGEEYIVFLEQTVLWKFADYLTPSHQFDASGGLFRIVNGRIEDPSNFWGLGTNPNFDDFLNYLLYLINLIKTWWL